MCVTCYCIPPFKFFGMGLWSGSGLQAGSTGLWQRTLGKICLAKVPVRRAPFWKTCLKFEKLFPFSVSRGGVLASSLRPLLVDAFCWMLFQMAFSRVSAESWSLWALYFESLFAAFSFFCCPSHFLEIVPPWKRKLKKQRIRVTKTAPKLTKHGLDCGSVFGPLFFIKYVIMVWKMTPKWIPKCSSGGPSLLLVWPLQKPRLPKWLLGFKGAESGAKGTKRV